VEGRMGAGGGGWGRETGGEVACEEDGMGYSDDRNDDRNVEFAH